MKIFQGKHHYLTYRPTENQKIEVRFQQLHAEKSDRAGSKLLVMKGTQYKYLEVPNLNTTLATKVGICYHARYQLSMFLSLMSLNVNAVKQFFCC